MDLAALPTDEEETDVDIVVVRWSCRMPVRYSHSRVTSGVESVRFVPLGPVDSSIPRSKSAGAQMHSTRLETGVMIHKHTQKQFWPLSRHDITDCRCAFDAGCIRRFMNHFWKP